MTYQHNPDQINQLAHDLENPDFPNGSLIAKAAFHLRELQRRIFELEAENKPLRILASGGRELFLRYSTFKAKCEELEAMLDAVGAGGVGESIKPKVQADTAPAAWAIYSDDGTAIRLWSKDKATAQEAADKFGLPLVPLYAAPQPAENLRCKSTQKRLATLWGYEKKDLQTDDSALLRQALEALSQFVEQELTVGQRYTNEGQILLDTITALRARLGEQQ